MCGICGFITKHKVSYDILRSMNDTMIHRGPNDGGEEIYSMQQNISVGLAHRRLSILDLSKSGHQPMTSSDGRVSLVYNGEIYNYKALKTELKDYPFCTNCDTEVIIAAYLKWGIDCVNHFNGMFAMAIFDRKTHEIYLARDRIGKKPLYYYWDHGEMIFASELKPILKHPFFTNSINTKILPRFLCQQYINAPDTIFEHTFKLEPGSVLLYKSQKITVWKYWDVAKSYHGQLKKMVKDYEQAKRELKELLEDAVKIRLVADVPVGLFLSGGYDSSLVTALAQHVSDVPVHTYCIGFEDQEFNEADAARKVSEKLGTIHTEHYITEKEMLELVDSIPKYYDEPFADPSQIPSMLVAKLAGQDVTVILTGDGGDEFFCGYNTYNFIKRAQRLDLLGNMIYTMGDITPFRKIDLVGKLPFKVQTIVQNHDKNSKTQFLISDHYIRIANEMVKGEKDAVLYPIELRYEENSWQQRGMLLDMDTYLPGDILCKVDRATMKYSLEARCPILDCRVMEYSFRLPQEFKWKKGNKKRILKDIAYEYIPKELLDRPKKGFGVPLDSWLRGPLRDQLQDLSSREYIEKQGIFNSQVIETLVSSYLVSGDGGRLSGRNYSKILWPYWCFQKWYQTYMQGKN